VYPWFTIPPPLPGIGRRSPQRLTLELNQDYLLSSEPQALFCCRFSSFRLQGAQLSGLSSLPSSNITKDSHLPHNALPSTK